MVKNDITFDHLLSLYIQERDIRPETIRHFKRVVRVFGRDTGINAPQDVTREAILLWKQQLLSRAQMVTWNNYFRHLRCLWHYALKHHYLDNNPFNDLRETRTYQRKHKTVTIEEIDKLLAFLQSDKEPLKPGWFWIIVIKTLYYTGIRRRQLTEMIWEDINFETKILRLRAETSKSRREWFIPLTDGLVEDLLFLRDKALEKRPMEDLSYEQVFNVTLFNHQYSGDCLDAEQLTGFFKRLSQKTGIAIGAHRLRHTAATQLVAHGALTDAQTFLGHTDIKMTAQYVHPDMIALRKTVNSIPSLAKRA